MVKTLQGWIEFYKEKTGSEFDVPNGFTISYLAERGFSVSKIDIENGFVIVYEACGDGKFWLDMAKIQAGTLGLKCVCTVVNRDIEVYLKAMGFDILKKFTHVNGYGGANPFENRYLCQDKAGRKVIFTYKGTDETSGNHEYFGTLYLHEKPSLDDLGLAELDRYSNEFIEKSEQHPTKEKGIY